MTERSLFFANCLSVARNRISERTTSRLDGEVVVRCRRGVRRSPYPSISLFAMLPVSVFLCFFSTQAAASKLSSQAVILDVNKRKAAFEPAAPSLDKNKISSLVRLDQFRQYGQFKSCTTQAQQLDSMVPELRSWLRLLRVKCALESSDIKMLRSALGSLVELNKQPQWVEFLDDKEVVNTLAQGWSKVVAHDANHAFSRLEDSLVEFTQFDMALEKKQRASIYELVGEAFFGKGQRSKAFHFWRISLSLNFSEGLQGKLLKHDGEASDLAVSQLPVELTGERYRVEKRIQQKAFRYLQKQEWVRGFRAARQYLEKYPQGYFKEEIARKVRNSLLQMSGSDGRKGKKKFYRWTRSWQNYGGDESSDWIRQLYYRDQYLETAILCQRLEKALRQERDREEALYLCGKAFQFTGELDAAAHLYSVVHKQYSDKIEGLAATLRLGFVNYRKKEYEKAAVYFNEVLASPQGNKYENMALYWLWRSYEKTEKAQSALLIAQRLVDKYPLTYYGLRARLEKIQPKETVSRSQLREVKDFKMRMYLSPSQRQGWSRYLLLQKVGWADEAAWELDHLPFPSSMQGRVIKSFLLAEAQAFPKAIRELDTFWTKYPHYKWTPLLQLVFPLHYEKALEKASEKHGLEEALLRAIVRQESGYDPDAVSPSQAMGLMQLIPMTAQEMAKYRLKRSLELPFEMFKPDRNIALGSYYVWRLQRGLNGHLPMVLASYNAGIGRILRWQRHQPYLESLSKTHNSEPIHELWIDELPWSETRFYVKAILRNLLLYRLLMHGELEWQNPLWKKPG